MALTIEVKVVPHSGKQGFKLDTSGILKCYLKNPAQQGRANEELIMLLAKALRIPKKDIHIIVGATGQKKLIKIQTTVTHAQLLSVLGIEVQEKIFNKD